MSQIDDILKPKLRHMVSLRDEFGRPNGKVFCMSPEMLEKIKSAFLSEDDSSPADEVDE